MDANKYFLASVRCEKTMQNGTRKTVTEQYLIDALSFTEAEARIIQEMTPFHKEFTIPQITKCNITDLFTSVDEEDTIYYKVRIAFISVDNNGEDKRTNSFVIVQAKNFDAAVARVKYEYKDSVSDWIITQVTETPILDFYPYVEVTKSSDDNE